MKPADTVVLPLVSKQDLLKALPHPLAGTFAPNGDIDILDLIDTNQSRPQVVKPKTRLDEVCPLVHVLCPQWYPKPSKAPLEFAHTPFCSLAI